MKHIKLFESFNDVPDSMRDLFGLKSKFDVYDYWGEWAYVLEGPCEHEDEAKVIGDKIGETFRDKEDDYYSENNDDQDLQEFLESVIKDSLQQEETELTKMGWELYWEPRGDESEEEV